MSHSEFGFLCAHRLLFQQESDSPESAVAKLFASAKRNGMQFSQYGDVAQCLQQLPSEGQLQVFNGLPCQFD